VNRPGNAPSHTDAAQWIDRSLDLVVPHAPRVCLRGDTDFSLRAHFDRWAERADFIFGMDCSKALRDRAEALEEGCWRRLERTPKRVPLYDLMSNWAYMVMAALAWNLKSWLALMMHRKSDRAAYIRMEFRRFLHTLILIPARVERRARGITIRLIGCHPTLDRLFGTWRMIESVAFT
jgi:hypothetical protein